MENIKVIGTKKQRKLTNKAIVNKVKHALEICGFNVDIIADGTIISDKNALAKMIAFNNNKHLSIYFGFYDNHYRIVTVSKSFMLDYGNFVYGCDFTDNEGQNALMEIIKMVKEL